MAPTLGEVSREQFNALHGRVEDGLVLLGGFHLNAADVAGPLGLSLAYHLVERPPAYLGLQVFPGLFQADEGRTQPYLHHLPILRREEKLQGRAGRAVQCHLLQLFRRARFLLQAFLIHFIHNLIVP